MKSRSHTASPPSERAPGVAPTSHEIIVGWKAIAAEAGLSIRHLKRMALEQLERSEDAPPVRKRFGRVYARRAELVRWIAEHDRDYWSTDRVATP